MSRSLVFLECPECHGLGGGLNLNGSQQICPSCHNLGHITKMLDNYENELKANIINDILGNIENFCNQHNINYGSELQKLIKNKYL